MKGNWSCARTQTINVKPLGGLANIRLAFRVAILDKDWPRARSLAPIVLSPMNGGASLWVINLAHFQCTKGDCISAGLVLDFIRDIGTSDPRVWYELGRAYETVGLAVQRQHRVDSFLVDGMLAYEDNAWFDRAASAYRSGIEIDPKRPWVEGTHDLSLLNYHQAHWDRVILVLGPLLTQATDAQIQQPILGRFLNGPDWQGDYILLGNSYQQLSDLDNAAMIWLRMVNIQKANLDWTLNIGLRSLASIEAQKNNYDGALSYFAKALDLALAFPDDYRAAYEQATWDEIVEFIHDVRSQASLTRVKNIAFNITESSPGSASIHYILGLVNEANCQPSQAKVAYTEATHLTPAGTVTFANSLLLASEWQCEVNQ
jgi:tetratricopeptide (TPR) repeat protein